MKKYSIFIVACLLVLAGCSQITIDPEQPKEEVVESTAGTEPTNQIAPITEPVESEVVEESLTDKVKDFFTFEWLKKEEEANPVFYLALGDSLTRGVGDENDNYGWTGIFAQELEKWPAVQEVELDNRGKNGRRSDQLLTLLEKGHYDEQLEKANIITITLGGNDVMRVVKSDLLNLREELFIEAQQPFIDRYTSILTYIRAHTEAPIVMVGFYNPFSIITESPFEEIIHNWNVDIEMLANKTNNACFVSIEDLFVTNEDMVYHSDYFHPNATGYQNMANRVKERLTECNIEEMSDGLLGFEE